MVIGNHEFNAVAFATRNADDTDWCRPHNDKNRDQHKAFLDAVDTLRDDTERMAARVERLMRRVHSDKS